MGLLCSAATDSAVKQLLIRKQLDWCSNVAQVKCATAAWCGWVHLQKVQELKGLHLKAKAAIHHEQHQVSILGSIYHAMQVLQPGNMDDISPSHASVCKSWKHAEVGGHVSRMEQ